MSSYAIDIQTDHTRKLVRIRVEGRLDEQSYIEMANRGYRVANRHRYASLWDLRKVTLTFGLGALYFLTTKIPEKRKMEARGLKSAGLVGREMYEVWRFVETRNLNIGFARSVFLEEQEALRWLLGP